MKFHKYTSMDYYKIHLRKNFKTSAMAYGFEMTDMQ